MLDDKYLESLVKQAAEFGNGKIHIIVNNAGYTWDGVIHKVSSHQTNLSNFFLSQDENQRSSPQQKLTPSPDNRQTMGHHPRPPQHPTLQTRPRRSPLLPRQRRRAAQHRQHLLDLWPARQRRPSKLRPGQSRRHRPDQNHRQRMGPRLRRAGQHGRFRPHCDAPDGGQGRGGFHHHARRREGGAGDSAEAEGWEGGWGGCFQGHSAGQAGDCDGGCWGGVVDC
jgi:hypothetical protein